MRGAAGPIERTRKLLLATRGHADVCFVLIRTPSDMALEVPNSHAAEPPTGAAIDLLAAEPDLAVGVPAEDRELARRVLSVAVPPARAGRVGARDVPTGRCCSATC